jgi:WD40 repeat protein
MVTLIDNLKKLIFTNLYTNEIILLRDSATNSKLLLLLTTLATENQQLMYYSDRQRTMRILKNFRYEGALLELEHSAVTSIIKIDNKTIALALGNLIKIYSLNTKSFTASIEVGSIRNIALLRFDRIVCSYDSTSIAVYDINTLKCVKTIKEKTNMGGYYLLVINDNKIAVASGIYILFYVIEKEGFKTGVFGSNCVRTVKCDHGVTSLFKLTEDVLVVGFNNGYNNGMVGRYSYKSNKFEKESFRGLNSDVVRLIKVSDNTVISLGYEEIQRIAMGSNKSTVSTLGPEERVTCAILLDKHFVLIGTTTGDMIKYDIASLKEVQRITAGRCIEFLLLANEHTIISVCCTGAVRTWDPRLLKYYESTAGLGKYTTRYKSYYLVSEYNHKIMIYNELFSRPKVLNIPVSEANRITILDDQYAVLWDGSSSVTLINLTTETSKSIPTREEHFIDIQPYSKSRMIYLQLCFPSIAVIYDYQNDQLLESINLGLNLMNFRILNGDRIAFGALEGDIIVYNILDKRIESRFFGHVGKVLSIVQLRDNIISAGSDNIRLWDLNTGKCVGKLDYLLDGNHMFVLDQSRIAFVTKNESVVVFDVRNRRVLLESNLVTHSHFNLFL